MILIRDIFNLKFGKAKDAKTLLKEGKEISKKFGGFDNSRFLTDLTGPSYRLVMESEWPTLAEWESKMKEGMGHSDWQQWYQKFIPLVENSSREIFTVVEE